MEEIISLLGEKLDSEGLLDQVPAGLVISGGGAQTIDLIDVAEKVLGLPARIGDPPDVDGIMSELKSPSFSASIGLLLYGQKQGAGEVMTSKINFGDAFKNLNIKKFGKKILSGLQNLLP
jgi:cell division protein FtsA